MAFVSVPYEREQAESKADKNTDDPCHCIKFARDAFTAAHAA